MKLLDILKNNAINYPDKIIFEDENDTYIFAEIESISGKIYSYLVDNNIGKEDIVAIRIPRSGLIPIVMLGVWKAGAAFLVIGEHTPLDLVDYQIAEANPKMIFTAKHLNEAISYDYLEGYRESDEHDLACVVYSTGSSGMFKGSMHEYGAINKAVDREADYYNFDKNTIEPQDYRVVFQYGFYTMNAIISLFDVLVARYYIYVLPYEKIGDVIETGKILLEKKINVFSVTTKDYDYYKSLNSPYLSEIIVSLDTTSYRHDPDHITYNYYGMSESVSILTCFKPEKSYDITPIGKPFSDIKVKLIDENGNGVKTGEIGEICFVPEFWRGYIDQPEKTQAAFYDGWFHTGDMAYVDEDENYVAVGRKIDIAKVEEGFVIPILISLEFQKAFPNVLKSHVQIFDDEQGLIICLYYCGDEEYNTSEIIDKLSTSLPKYCLPNYFVRMDEFEYYPSGKINRKAFANPKS